MIHQPNDSLPIRSAHRNVLIVAVQCLIFLFPIGMGGVKSWASGGYLLTILLSLVAIWCADKGSVGRSELLWPLFFFYVALLLSLVNVEEWYISFKWMGKLIYFLFMIPVVLGLSRFSTAFVRPLSLGLLFAGFTSGGIAFYAQEVMHGGRKIGTQNPIIFGDLAMLIAVLIVCAGLAGIYQRWCFWLMPFSAGSAVYAAVASMTRGCWLVVPVIIVFLLFLFLKGDLLKGSFRRRWVVGIAVMFLVLMLLSPLVFSEKLGSQVTRTYNSLIDFSRNENLNTSTGVRLLLWNISLKVWREHPFLGTGMGDFVIEQERMIEEKQTPLQKPFPHAHNIYLDFLSRTGLFGFVAMVAALLVLPFRIFYRSLFRAQNSEEIFACLGGMMLIICYSVFGLTEAVFSRSPFIASFAFFMSVFLSAINGCVQLESKNERTDT